MYSFTRINDDVTYIGGSDRRLALFENMYPLTNGISYNSYIIMDEKTAIVDTVDKSVDRVFFENVEHILDGKKLDYIIINHMEPDHAATLGDMIIRYPEVQIVGNIKTLAMIKQYFEFEVDSRFVTVCEGDSLELGKHNLTFYMAPMVHWPEVMVTYDSKDKMLYSADAFGIFGALSGNVFADEMDFENTCLDEARRYYTNIVGKYGQQVQMLLKKVSGLEIEMICPLHGPVWRENLSWYIDKYNLWSTYTPETNTALIVYASIYGGTENAVHILAAKLAEQGIHDIVMYDVSKTHVSYIISEAFRCSHIVFASPTYNMGIFTNMETVLLDLVAHNLQKRKVAFIENGSWAPVSGKLMKEVVDKMKNTEIIGDVITVKSTVKSEQIQAFDKLASVIADSIKQ